VTRGFTLSGSGKSAVRPNEKIFLIRLSESAIMQYCNIVLSHHRNAATFIPSTFLAGIEEQPLAERLA